MPPALTGKGVKAKLDSAEEDVIVSHDARGLAAQEIKTSKRQVHMSVHFYILFCLSVSLSLYLYIHMPMCMHIHIYIYIYIYTYIHTYICQYVYTHMHIDSVHTMRSYAPRHHLLRSI